MRSSWGKEGGLTVIIVLLLAVRQLMPHWDTSPLCQRDGMKYGQTWKIFSKSKHAVEEHYTHWICRLLACFFHLWFSHSQFGIQGLGQCCNALLYLLKATWCKIKLSNILSIQKEGNWTTNRTCNAHNLYLHGVTCTNITTQTFKLILINGKLSGQKRLLLRSSSSQNQEKRWISWI